jgi:hypothetical protein
VQFQTWSNQNSVLNYNYEKSEWDVVISHASEDKLEVVKPLVDELQRHGIKFWYDDFTLKSGDSLRRRIYIDFAYMHSMTIYPMESYDLFAAGRQKLDYKMDTDLYWRFSDNPPVLQWTLYLREGYPVKDSKPFMSLQNF